MFLKNHMDRNLVFANLKPADKLTLLEELVEKTAARLPAIDRSQLLLRLKEREDQVSTGIGHGVAIPHATIDGLEESRCLVAQIPDGVEFASIDKASVHLVFLLLSPPGMLGTHIKLLARISRLVSREEFVRDVSLAEGSDRIYELVVREDERHVT